MAKHLLSRIADKALTVSINGALGVASYLIGTAPECSHIRHYKWRKRKVFWWEANDLVCTKEGCNGTRK